MQEWLRGKVKVRNSGLIDESLSGIVESLLAVFPLKYINMCE